MDNFDGSECEQEGNCVFPRVLCAWTDHPSCPGPENQGTRGVAQRQQPKQALEHLGLLCFHFPTGALHPGVLKSQSGKIPETVGSSGPSPASVLQTSPESDVLLHKFVLFMLWPKQPRAWWRPETRVVSLRPSEKLTKHAWPLAGPMPCSRNWYGLPQVPCGTLSSPT